MGINYESQVIGDLRATNVTGYSGVGVSQLRFALAWNIFPKEEEVFTVFGTSAWISVMPEGESLPLVLGQAVPETAWCEESRGGQPFERHLSYRLTLPSPQLLAVEQLRQGRGLVFTLDVRGNSLGSRGIRPFDTTLSMNVNPSEWSRVLKEANAADVLLVGIHLPLDGSDAGSRAAIDLVRKANEHLVFGHYTAAVAECRRAIESLWKSANFVDEARAARKLLSTMNDQLSMSKRDRELALGEALKIFTHAAHHVGADAEPEVFGRLDAALAVAATAALVSSLVGAPRPVKSPVRITKAVTENVKASSPPGVGINPSDVSSIAERVAKAIEHFRKRPANRPRTMKSLQSDLGSLFGNKIAPTQLDELIRELKGRNIVVEAEGKLTYAVAKP